MKATVSNSTALIAFGNIGRFDILKEVYGNIIIPNAVYREIKSISLPNWIERESICSHKSYELLVHNYNIHAGEAEAIILADELSRKMDVGALLMDENMGRACATDMFSRQKYPKIHSVIHTCKIAEKKGIIGDHISFVLNHLWKNGYQPPVEEKIRLLQSIMKQEGK